MAYENPYANAMNYKPRTVWTQPERPRTDWSTFWGQADEDEEETTEEIRGDRDDTKEQDKLQSLWGDIVKDFETGYGQQINQAVHPTQFSNQNLANLGNLTPMNQQYSDYAVDQGISQWQNPNYTGGNTQAQQVGDTQATPAEIAAFNTQQQGYMNNLAGDTTSAYSPSYATQADAYAQYPELEQNWSWAENMPVSAQFDQSGNLIDQGNAVVQTQGANFLDVQPTSGASYSDRNIFSPEIEDEDIDFEDKDWGDFW